MSEPYQKYDAAVGGKVSYVRCDVCGWEAPLMEYLPPGVGRHPRHSSSSSSPSSTLDTSDYRCKKLDDGTFLVCWYSDDIDANHWHVASDGTVLSIKEGGSHRYKRHSIREDIARVTGIPISRLWRG